MPFLQMDSTAGKKRKRVDADAKTSREKHGSSMLQKKQKVSKEHIEELEAGIIESQRNYNDIAELQTIATNEDDSEAALQAYVSLCRIFGTLMAGGNLTKSNSNAESEIVIFQWLKDRYSEYQDALLDLQQQGTLRERKIALELSMRLTKEETTHLKHQGDFVWRSGIFAKAVRQILERAPVEDETRSEFARSYIVKYDDVRYWTTKVIE